MNETILVAVITAGLGFLGNLISTQLSHGKTLYRIEQLERKQDIHNGIIERMYKAEKDIEVLDERQKVANHRIDDLERKGEKHGTSGLVE